MELSLVHVRRAGDQLVLGIHANLRHLHLHDLGPELLSLLNGAPVRPAVPRFAQGELDNLAGLAEDQGGDYRGNAAHANDLALLVEVVEDPGHVGVDRWVTAHGEGAQVFGCAEASGENDGLYCICI